MSDEHTKLEVGKLYIEGKTNWEEQYEYNYIAKQHLVRMFVKDLKEHEIKSFRENEIKFSFWWDNPVLWFFFNVEGFLEWGESPFSIHRVKQFCKEDYSLPPIITDDNIHYTVVVVLIDADTGIIQGLRYGTFSPEFSKKIHLAIIEQSKTKESSEIFMHHILDRRSNYPHTKMMQKLVDCTCTLGD